MDVLRIRTEDLTLTVAANGVDVAYDRSKRKQQDRIATSSRYGWSGGECELYHGENRAMRPLLNDSVAPPVFFENKDYVFEIELENGVNDARISSRLREVKESFIQRKDRLVGVLNFGNELGRSDLLVRYVRNGKPGEFRLDFEVFSTKLDQKTDLHRIMDDIEREYPLLVLDVMRKTYSNFKAGGGVRSDLVWWQVFAGIYAEFIKAARFIQNKPHSRLVAREQWERADRLKQLSPRLEEELSQWRHAPEHRYHTTHRSLSLNTPENRFFKYASDQVARRFDTIRSHLVRVYGKSLSEEYHNELAAISKSLGAIRNHPLFRSVGPFTGLRQESLVLQRATGYSTVYKNWIMLQRGISFLEDMQRMETKNIADLYQIWCFLEMKNIVNDVLGREKPDEVDLGLVQERGLVLQLAQGKGSRLGYDLANGEVLELFHEFSISGSDGAELKTFTGPQRPDIALRIRKNDLKDDYMLTYLFDAKYRLASDEKEDAPDVPPPDALNQMHRYRDAIYYMERKANMPRPEKEVIGGYVLFPGEGDPERIRQNDFHKAIEQVNIGAFPLRPGDPLQRSLLREHVERIIKGTTANLLSDVRPHRSMRYGGLDAEVIIAPMASAKQANYLLDGGSTYHFGVQRPARFGNDRLRFFAPYITEKGVGFYYEVEEYYMCARDRIYAPGHALHRSDDPNERLVLRLGAKQLLHSGMFFKVKGPFIPFRYTLLSLLRAPVNGTIDLVKVEELPSIAN